MFVCFGLDDDNLFLLDHYSSATSSTFHVDPFGMVPQPIRETNSPLNMFSSTFTNTNNNFFTQSQPKLIPTRVATPTSVATNITQSPLILKDLSLNPTKKKHEPIIDLLDFSEPNLPPPPESPKFDPYA